MMIPLLLTAGLFSQGTPEAERKAILGAFFEPRPHTTITLDEKAIAARAAKAFTIRGDIWVRPPRGTCFIVRTDYQKKDQRICKPTQLHWEVYDLDAMGTLRMEVMLDESWDEGTFLKWNTPYRVGNIVPAGELENGIHHDVALRSCTATEEQGERRIVLEAFSGRRWIIALPEYDVPAAEDLPAAPNLIVNVDSSETPEDAKKNEQKISILAQLLTGTYKKKEVHHFVSRVPKRDAFEMESGRFSEDAGPKGMTGRCRYKYRDAPGDASSGMIECFYTDTLDSVFMPVTCFSQFQPRLKPASENK